MPWNPWSELDDTGLDVYNAPCRASGLYFPDEHLIVLAVGLTESEQRSVLAEELGHHLLGHRPHRSVTFTNRMELRARRWAATQLIELEELADAIAGAATWFDVAEDLGVDVPTLEQRIGDLSEEDRGEVRRMVGRRELLL